MNHKKFDQEHIDVFNHVVSRAISYAPVVEEIWFHGSRARGDNKPSSDWDFLAVLPDAEMGGALFNCLSNMDGPFYKLRFNLPKKALDVQATFDTGSVANPLTYAKIEGYCLWSRGAKLY